MALSTSNDHSPRSPDRPDRGVPAPASSAPRDRAPDLPWFLDWREVLLTLARRGWWVALPVLVALLLAFAALTLIPAKYTASTEILIDPQGLQIVKDDLNPPAQANEGSLFLVDSQIKVLSSDDNLGQVVDRFRLDRDPEFIGETSIVSRVVGPLMTLLGVAGQPHDPRLDALRTLRERVKVKRMERTFALSVDVTTRNRAKSAQLSQGVAETYLTNDQQVRTNLAQRASAAVSARLGELQADVRDAENKAQAFRTAQNLVGTRTQLVSEQQLGQIGEQLGAARARAAEQLARLNQIESALRSGASLDAMPEVLQSATITQLRTQLANAERTLADQATRLGTRHPAYISAESAVRSAQAQLNGEVKRIAASIRDQYKATAGNVSALSDSLDKGKSEAVSVGDAMVRLRELERQIDARRSVYESFLVRARELQAQQQVGTSASRIISPATPPAQRDGPPIPLLLGAVLVASLGCGVGGALLAEASSGRVRTVRRLAQHLGFEVAGALPPLKGTGGEETTDLASENRYDLAVMRLRNHLWRVPTVPGKRLIVVTAADRVSGKARLALKLATVAAADHNRVLLVDADPDGDLPGEFDLPITPVSARAPDGHGLLPERGVAHSPGLRYVAVSRRAAKLEFKTVADQIAGRLREFDVIVVNAGIIGADLFTERLVGDARTTLVLLAVSAGRSSFGTLDHALAKVDRGPAFAGILTDALPVDL